MTHSLPTAMSHYERFSRQDDDFSIQNLMDSHFGIGNTKGKPNLRDGDKNENSEQQETVTDTILDQGEYTTPRKRGRRESAPHTPDYMSWTEGDGDVLKNIVQSQKDSGSKKICRDVIEGVTPKSLVEKYGVERCYTKARREMSKLLSPKSAANLGTMLPKTMHRCRKRMSGAMSQDVENKLWNLVEDGVNKMATGTVSKKEKITSKPLLKILLEEAGFESEYTFDQIHTKVVGWVSKAMESGKKS